MVASEGRGWVEQLPSVQREEVNIHPIWGAAHLFLGGIWANPNSANNTACTLVCVMPYC
jgi:hypothetical protein